ncbi:hypothetical protein [Lonsdalea quercina]|uniref:hypothetical protein n=1 Tax=Lonsdalea quercina TaxID=71657 RepID=UPI0039754E45
MQDMRQAPGEGGYPAISKKNVAIGCNEINQHIPGFVYTSQLTNIMRNEYLVALYPNTLSSYEKLQLFRLLAIGIVPGNSVVKKFINDDLLN